MDFYYLQTHLGELLEYLDQHGYALTYRNRYKTIVKQITAAAPEHQWSCYADVYEWYCSNYSSPTYLHEIRAVIGKLELFHLKGVMPDNKNTASGLCGGKAAYHSLNNAHKSLVDGFCAYQRSRKLKESTVKSTATKASSFLLELQSKGVSFVGMATPDEILSCFMDGEERKRCGSVAAKISLFLRTSAELSADSSLAKAASYVPQFRSSRKNIAYLTDDEVVKIHDVIADGNSGLSLKDRAVGFILLYTGLRGCDIAALRLSAIDWEGDIINVTQQKTQRKIRLPLLPIVGNAIYDYCIGERPRTEAPFLFVGTDAPHNGLTTDGIAYSVTRIMDEAGIRMEKGGRRGTHIFRHRFATALLGKGVQQPVITEAMGHSSPSSLEPYLYADLVHLRECALSVEQFPVSEEVFAHV